jgi:hypothetical protein
MNPDPIVAELHQIRQRILEECGGDLDRLLDRWQAAEAQDQHRLVSAERSQGRRQRASVVAEQRATQ